MGWSRLGNFVLVLNIMEPQKVQSESLIAPLNKVTPLSKYLALLLFVLMPFIGAYIGYTFAPVKVVEVVREKIVTSQSENLIPFSSDQRYKTDRVQVYLFDDLEPLDEIDKIEKYTLDGADPESFEPFIVSLFDISQGNTYQGWISRDKNSVYYQNQKITGADPESFVIDENIPITKDKDDVFLYFKKIPGADPKSYEVVFNTGAGGRGKVFGKDVNNCYLEYAVLSCEEMPDTFEDAINFAI